MSENDFVPALLEERRGYVVRGLQDRVAEVDVELAKFGIEVGDDNEPEGDDLETADGAPAKAPAKKPAPKK